jgi:hypothetical protein
MLEFSEAQGAYVCPGHWYEEPLKENPSSTPSGIRHPFSGVIAFLIFSSFLLAVVLFGTYDLGRAHYWNSLETTTVEELPDSGTVKVVGMINESVVSTAIGQHETNLDVGYSTEYDPDGGFFNFSDETGTVNISWEHWYEIENGIHKKLTTHGETAHVYEGGDTIMIIGTVEGAGDEKRIDLLFASPQDQEVHRSWIQHVSVLILLPLHILLYGIAIRTTLRRNRSHCAVMKSLVPFEPVHPPITMTGIYGSDTTSPPLEIQWHQNSRNIPFPIFYLISFVLVLFSLTWFGKLLIETHIRAEYLVITLMFPMGALFVLMCVFYALNWSYTKPRRVGVSDQGIHFLYADPFVQLSYPGFVGWDEINFIGTRITGAETSNPVIGLGKRSSIDISDVKKKIRKAMITEWKGRTSAMTERQRRYESMKMG